MYPVRTYGTGTERTGADTPLLSLSTRYRTTNSVYPYRYQVRYVRVVTLFYR